MKKLFFLLLFASLAYGSNITSHNIYKQDDSVDLMLTFDKPYLGKISKKKDANGTILMLEGLKIDKSITKEISSNIIQQIQILPYKNQTFVKVNSVDPTNLQASKTVDNYGLRIRVKKTPPLLPIQTKKFETKKESDISGGFLKVIAVLGFLLLILYLLKRWLSNQNSSTGSGWLFHKDSNKKQDIKILNQKVLDAKNRVALLEFNDTNYLVILGNSNIILDKFKSDKPKSEQNFDELLNQKSQKLGELLKSNS